MVFMYFETETSDFIQVPSPSLVVAALMSEYTYYCSHSQTTRIFWKLNGMIFDFFDLPFGIDGGSDSIPGGRRVYTLTIRGLPEYNGTRVQCVAELNGVSVETSTTVFFIQGQLISMIMID